MKPDGLLPSVLLGVGLGAAGRLVVARRLMVLSPGFVVLQFVWNVREMLENDTAEKRGKSLT